MSWRGRDHCYALFNTTVIAAPWVGWLGDRIGRTRVVLGYSMYAGRPRTLWLE